MTKEISITGQMHVDTLKQTFKDNFGVNIRVYYGAKFAKGDVTLHSIKVEGATVKGDAFSVHGNASVGKVEKDFLDKIGVKIQVENTKGELADNSASIGELRGATPPAAPTG